MEEDHNSLTRIKTIQNLNISYILDVKYNFSTEIKNCKLDFNPLGLCLINNSINSGFIGTFEGQFGLYSFKIVDKKISLRKVLKSKF